MCTVRTDFSEDLILQNAGQSEEHTHCKLRTTVGQWLATRLSELTAAVRVLPPLDTAVPIAIVEKNQHTNLAEVDSLTTPPVDIRKTLGCAWRELGQLEASFHVVIRVILSCTPPAVVDSRNAAEHVQLVTRPVFPPNLLVVCEELHHSPSASDEDKTEQLRLFIERDILPFFWNVQESLGRRPATDQILHLPASSLQGNLSLLRNSLILFCPTVSGESDGLRKENSMSDSIQWVWELDCRRALHTNVSELIAIFESAIVMKKELFERRAQALYGRLNIVRRELVRQGLIYFCSAPQAPIEPFPLTRTLLLCAHFAEDSTWSKDADSLFPSLLGDRKRLRREVQEECVPPLALEPTELRHYVLLSFSINPTNQFLLYVQRCPFTDTLSQNMQVRCVEWWQTPSESDDHESCPHDLTLWCMGNIQLKFFFQSQSSNVQRSFKSLRCSWYLREVLKQKVLRVTEASNNDSCTSEEGYSTTPRRTTPAENSSNVSSMGDAMFAEDVAARVEFWAACGSQRKDLPAPIKFIENIIH